ncbi:MAG: ATP-dependent zinc metalloprotease FtsH, partial [Acidimicrobiales bacterium]
AEELIFSEPTTGAQDDIEKATAIARAMVTEYGMSDNLGPQQLGQKQGEVFLGRDYGHQANYSDEVAGRIDTEIRGLLDAAHKEARAVLTKHRKVLDQLAEALIEQETLDTSELNAIIGGLPVWGRPSTAAKGNGTAKSAGARSNGQKPARRRSRSTKAD